MDTPPDTHFHLDRLGLGPSILSQRLQGELGRLNRFNRNSYRQRSLIGLWKFFLCTYNASFRYAQSNPKEAVKEKLYIFGEPFMKKQHRHYTYK